MESVNKKILLTGATGFVGGAVLRYLCRHPEYSVRAVTRKPAAFSSEVSESVSLGDLSPSQSWEQALKDIDVVIHSAARVHVMNEQASDPLSEFRKVNVAGTLNLAAQSAMAGVKRFIFISSIKVNGEETTLGTKYTADGTVHPVDGYGISKAEAEQGLLKISAETGMEVVIIRPVLVYGVGVKANFMNMMKLVEKGIPLPLSSVKNKRSFVALDNLVDFISVCISHPRAANQIFLVSDGEDLSTPELLKKIAKAFGKNINLLPFPVSLLRVAARLVGKENITNRLCGSLEVDISKNRELLDWTPPMTVDNALLEAVRHYLGSRNQ
ncbi:SDR family oxidoreductase [Pseudomonas sp. MRSN 12121]|uniref:UDP-glucose 4-epimerase family protein n=1 Tax=Pseudomonas sp. MRSN 12121 TaxID=1611770 RepID=UPI0009E53D05|nr:SDR family oxidoreductase [Pseudomonas sp. MRSN 12121]